MPCLRGSFYSTHDSCVSDTSIHLHLSPDKSRTFFSQVRAKRRKKSRVTSDENQAIPKELFRLNNGSSVLDGIPLLVLGNKSDLPNKLSVDELIEALNMKAISHREVSCYGISAKEETNLDAFLEWLIKKTAH